MADWRDILSDNEEQLSQEDLLKYLHDDVYSAPHTQAIDPFDADARQGLSKLQNDEALQKHVNQLNQKLQQLTQKKTRKEKKQINIFQWVIVAIVFLLFVCIISYVVINLLNKNHQHLQILDFGKKAFFYL